MEEITLKPEELLEKMKKMTVLETLSDEDKIKLAQIAVYLKLKHREQIIKEGEGDTFFYLLLKGKVSVMVERDGGKEVFIDTIRENNLFGESAIFSDVKRTASVFAEGPVEMLRFEKQVFIDFIKDNSAIGIGMLLTMVKNLMKKLREANQDIALYREDSYGDEKDASSQFKQVFINLDIID